jgi:hypothetical protein
LINFVTPPTYQKGVYVNRTLPLSDSAKMLHSSPLATTTTIQRLQPPKHHNIAMMKQQAKELLTKLLLFLNEKTNDDDIITQSNNNNNNNTLRFNTYKPMVIMELSCELPVRSHVQYELWTIPSNCVARGFLMAFGALDTCFGESASFTPHAYIYDGAETHCTGTDGENLCYTLSTNNGRYCATDPDDDLDRGISGTDVVKESLRCLCIWNRYSEIKEGVKWWNFVGAFEEHCYAADLFMQDDCS